MENPCDFGICLRDQCHKLSQTRKIGLLNFSEWETSIKTTPFWQTCIGPESNLKNIYFHHKELFGKRFEEHNNKCCNVFNTRKKGKVSHSPYLQKQAMGLLFKDNRIWEISRTPLCPPPSTSLLYGCHKWMAPKQFLTLKG